jgi:hypothetical protein
VIEPHDVDVVVRIRCHGVPPAVARRVGSRHQRCQTGPPEGPCLNPASRSRRRQSMETRWRAAQAQCGAAARR